MNQIENCIHASPETVLKEALVLYEAGRYDEASKFALVVAKSTQHLSVHVLEMLETLAQNLAGIEQRANERHGDQYVE